MRALAKDPERRYADGHAIARALIHARPQANGDAAIQNPARGARADSSTAVLFDGNRQPSPAATPGALPALATAQPSATAAGTAVLDPEARRSPEPVQPTAATRPRPRTRGEQVQPAQSTASPQRRRGHAQDRLDATRVAPHETIELDRRTARRPARLAIVLLALGLIAAAALVIRTITAPSVVRVPRTARPHRRPCRCARPPGRPRRCDHPALRLGSGRDRRLAAARRRRPHRLGLEDLGAHQSWGAARSGAEAGRRQSLSAAEQYLALEPSRLDGAVRPGPGHRPRHRHRPGSGRRPLPPPERPRHAARRRDPAVADGHVVQRRQCRQLRSVPDPGHAVARPLHDVLRRHMHVHPLLRGARAQRRSTPRPDRRSISSTSPTAASSPRSSTPARGSTS